MLGQRLLPGSTTWCGWRCQAGGVTPQPVVNFREAQARRPQRESARTMSGISSRRALSSATDPSTSQEPIRARAGRTADTTDRLSQRYLSLTSVICRAPKRSAAQGQRPATARDRASNVAFAPPPVNSLPSAQHSGAIGALRTSRQNTGQDLRRVPPTKAPKNSSSNDLGHGRHSQARRGPPASPRLTPTQPRQPSGTRGDPRFRSLDRVLGEKVVRAVGGGLARPCGSLPFATRPHHHQRSGKIPLGKAHNPTSATATVTGLGCSPEARQPGSQRRSGARCEISADRPYERQTTRRSPTYRARCSGRSHRGGDWSAPGIRPQFRMGRLVPRTGRHGAGGGR